MDQIQLLAHCGSNKITREELRMVPTPEGTESHHPLAHHLIVDALAETLAFRHISVVRDEYAVSEDEAKLVIYQAFVEEALEAPKHLARRVHDLYFNPQFEEFAPRTRWSLANAFTSAFKELDPIPQFKATAKLGAFLVSPSKAPSMLARTDGET